MNILPPTSSPETHPGKMVFALVALVLLAIIIVGGYYLYNRNSGEVTMTRAELEARVAALISQRSKEPSQETVKRVNALISSKPSENPVNGQEIEGIINQ